MEGVERGIDDVAEEEDVRLKVEGHKKKREQER